MTFKTLKTTANVWWKIKQSDKTTEPSTLGFYFLVFFHCPGLDKIYPRAAIYLMTAGRIPNTIYFD